MRQIDQLQSLQIRCVAVSMLCGVGSLIASRFGSPTFTRFTFYGFLVCLAAIFLLGFQVWRLQRRAATGSKQDGSKQDGPKQDGPKQDGPKQDGSDD